MQVELARRGTGRLAHGAVRRLEIHRAEAILRGDDNQIAQDLRGFISLALRKDDDHARISRFIDRRRCHRGRCRYRAGYASEARFGRVLDFRRAPLKRLAWSERLGGQRECFGLDRHEYPAERSDAAIELRRIGPFKVSEEFLHPGCEMRLEQRAVRFARGE